MNLLYNLVIFGVTQNIAVDYMDLKFKNYTLANMPIAYFFQDKHLIIDTLSSSGSNF